MNSINVEPHQTNWLIQLLPFIFTLFMFWLTRMIEYAKNKYQIKNDIIRIHDYFDLWINLIEPQTRKQINRLNELIVDIGDDVFENFSSVSIHADKLNEISTKEMVSAFYTNLKGDSHKRILVYFELVNFCERLQNAQSEFIRIFEINRAALFEILEEWDSEMHKFNAISGRILIEGLRLEPNNADLMKVQEIFQEPLFKQSVPMPLLIEKLIKPASDIFIVYYAKKEKSELFYNMGDTVRRLNVCSRRYNSFKKSAITCLFRRENPTLW